VKRRHNARFEILLTLDEYSVTTSPIPDPAYDRLPAAVRAEAEAIHNELVDGGTVTISRVQDLVRRHPDVPTFRNHLFQAQLAAGEQDAAEATILRCVEEHPDYLFGLCGLAKLHLARSEPWKVPGVFRQRLALTDLVPDRRVFHVSEVVEFETTMAWYHLRVGELAAAREHYRVVAKVAPRHSITKKFRRYFGRGPVARLRGAVVAWMSRHSRAGAVPPR
jgi:hypothetical protein